MMKEIPLWDGKSDIAIPRHDEGNSPLGWKKCLRRRPRFVTNLPLPSPPSNFFEIVISPPPAFPDLLRSQANDGRPKKVPLARLH